MGKTALAHEIARGFRGKSTFFDLERSADLSLLADPELALRPLRGLVLLDEVQRRPELFPTLRVLADRRPLPARFLVLGSASPALGARPAPARHTRSRPDPGTLLGCESLRLKRLDAVHAGDRTGDLARGIRAVALERLLEDLDPLG